MAFSRPDVPTRIFLSTIGNLNSVQTFLPSLPLSRIFDRGKTRVWSRVDVIIQLLSKYIPTIYTQWKNIYIYTIVISSSKEYHSVDWKKKSKAFDTRSTNNVRGWKIFVRRSADKISIPPLLVAVRKIRNRRFTGWGAGGGGKGDSRVSATHINRFARRTASKRWLTDGKEVGEQAWSAGIRV